MSHPSLPGRNIFLSLIPAGLCALIASCGGSSASSSSGTASTQATLPAATAAFQQRMTTETPHVVSSSVVTGYRLFPRRSYQWSTLWGNLLPERVFADQLGLSVVWDPENGNAPTGSDFAVNNLYNGGGFTCDNTTNTCTNGGTTIADEESLKSYMGQALNPDFQNSNGASVTLFGRLQNATLIVCAIGQLVPAASLDTDGLPVVGPLTLTLPTDTTAAVYQPISSGGCGASTSMAGYLIQGTVTAVSSADYAKLITLSLGQTNLQAWLKLDAAAGTLSVMSLEDQRPSGRYAIDRMIAQITGINTPGAATVRFEFISIGSNTGDSDSCYSNGRWTCSFEMHRVYIDESQDVAYLVSNEGDPGDASGGTSAPTRYIQYTGAGKPSALKACSTAGDSCSGTLALSVTADGQMEPSTTTSTVYPSAGHSYNACIDISSRSIAVDATLVCDLTGADILAGGGASQMIDTTRAVYVGDVVATLFDHTTAMTTLAFSRGADIYTAANTQ